MSVYLRVAELIETGAEYTCCPAIDRVAGRYWSAARTEFMDLFEPRARREKRGRDGLLWMELTRDSNEAAKHRRIVAMCLMHAMQQSNQVPVSGKQGNAERGSVE